jgi:hypothetical protein
LPPLDVSFVYFPRVGHEDVNHDSLLSLFLVFLLFPTPPLSSPSVRSFPVQRCIMLKHLSKEVEAIPLVSQSPPAKRPCPDLQVRPAAEAPLSYSSGHTIVKGFAMENKNGCRLLRRSGSPSLFFQLVRNEYDPFVHRAGRSTLPHATGATV